MNYSVSLVQYEKFIRERKIATRLNDINRKNYPEKHRTDYNDDGDGDGDDDDDGDGDSRDSKDSSSIRSEEKNSSNIINDIKWMLEFNQKGLMHLILYFFHILILVIQILKSLVYTTFPLDRDPITNEYINPWLKFCETIYLHDANLSSHILPFRLLGMISLHYLLLRLRALYLKIETAKINKHRYKKINTVHLNTGFQNEFRFTLEEWFNFFKNNFNHNCEQYKALKGTSRKRLLEFNRKIRNLEKMDKYYYFNQIDFVSCSKNSKYLDEYIKKIDNINVKIRNENEKEHNDQISWLQYISSINLPNRIPYIPQPMFRVDVKFVAIIILVFSILTIAVVISAAIYFVTITYIILIDDSVPYETLIEKLSQTRYIVGIVELYLTIIMLTFNSYDNGLLVYSVILLLSRSRKVIMLLDEESNFSRAHLIEFCKFMNANVFKPKRMFHPEEHDQNGMMLMKRNMYLSHPDTKEVLRRPSMFEQPERMRSILALENYDKMNSIVRSQVINLAPKNDDEESSDYDEAIEFYEITKRYKESLNQQSLKHFNENLDYLVDLIEVLRCEFRDLQSFYSTFLNITIIFSTVGLSIALAIILNSVNIKSKVLGLLGGSACLLPMTVSLLIGATSEGIFRRIYRKILPLMVNELRLIEPNVKLRMDKSCKDLAQIETRSFIILGSIPLTSSTLTSNAYDLKRCAVGLLQALSFFKDLWIKDRDPTRDCLVTRP